MSDTPTLIECISTMLLTIGAWWGLIRLAIAAGKEEEGRRHDDSVGR